MAVKRGGHGEPWPPLFRFLADMMTLTALALPSRRLALGLALAIAAPAMASSPAAWAKGDAEARRACLRTSDLAAAEAIAGPILFSDTAGKTAFLVRGRWRPAHMRGAKATMLCLYDRASRRAEVAEATGWAVR